MRIRPAAAIAPFVLSLLLASISGAAARSQDDGEIADPFASGGSLRLAVGNGLTALVVSDAKSKEVAVRLELGGGVAADPAGREGLAAIAAAALLGEPSGAYPGGEVEAGPAATTLRFRLGAGGFGPALGALAARLASGGSSVSPASFEAAKKAAAERAASAAGAADRALASALFGSGHPAGRSWAGVPESIASIRVDDARAALAPAIPASRAALAVVGPVVGVEALAEIPIRLAAWPGAKSSPAALLPKLPRQGRRAVLVAAEGPVLEVRAAFLLPPRGDPRLPRVAAAAALAIRVPPGAVPGSLALRFHGRRTDATALVVSWRAAKIEEAAAGIAALEPALASARAAQGDSEAAMPGIESLGLDLRAAIAILESNPDENALASPPAATSGPAIDLDSIVAVIAGPSAGNAEASLRASGLAIEKR